MISDSEISEIEKLIRNSLNTDIRYRKKIEEKGSTTFTKSYKKIKIAYCFNEPNLEVKVTQKKQIHEKELKKYVPEITKGFNSLKNSVDEILLDCTGPIKSCLEKTIYFQPNGGSLKFIPFAFKRHWKVFYNES